MILAQKRKIIAFFIILLLAFLVSLFVIWFLSLKNYKKTLSTPTSQLQESLVFFNRNINQHPDEIKGCWYDAGDFLIFSPRVAEAVWYLSLAYKQEKNDIDKKAILETLTPALKCVEEMDKQRLKQFRDVRSHAVHLLPLIHRFLTPQTKYFYESGEGLDVALFLSLTHDNLGNYDQANYWKEIARTRISVTKSNNCCEEGPLVLNNDDLNALEYLGQLSDEKKYPSTAIWGAQIASIAEVSNGDTVRVKRVLDYVQENWNFDGDGFDYIGGNYDIVGTIALACLYKNKTGYTTFEKLKGQLTDYIHGKNDYGIDFTNLNKDIYHTCGWYGVCELPNSLVNGIDESMTFDLSRNAVWRISEVQTVGQAIYVLSLACN